MGNATPHNAGADHRNGFYFSHYCAAFSKSAIMALIAPPAARKLSARRLRSSEAMGGIEIAIRRNVLVMSST
jgi:hypothetical protein